MNPKILLCYLQWLNQTYFVSSLEDGFPVANATSLGCQRVLHPLYELPSLPLVFLNLLKRLTGAPHTQLWVALQGPSMVGWGSCWVILRKWRPQRHASSPEGLWLPRMICPLKQVVLSQALKTFLNLEPLQVKPGVASLCDPGQACILQQCRRDKEPQQPLTADLTSSVCSWSTHLPGQDPSAWPFPPVVGTKSSLAWKGTEHFQCSFVWNQCPSHKAGFIVTGHELCLDVGKSPVCGCA